MMAGLRGTPGTAKILETLMRKCALLFALAFAVAATMPASAAKRKAAAPDPAIQAQKDSAAFFADALHPWAPTATTPTSKAKKKKRG